DTAMLLARESVNLHVDEQTRNELLSTLLRSPTAIGAMYGTGRPLIISLTPDGRTLTIAENTGTILLRDSRTGRDAEPPIHAQAVIAMAYSPDGRYLAVMEPGPAFSLRLELLDAHDVHHRVIRMLPIPGSIAHHRWDVVTLAFSTDRPRLLASFGAEADDT